MEEIKRERPGVYKQRNVKKIVWFLLERILGNTNYAHMCLSRRCLSVYHSRDRSVTSLQKVVSRESEAVRDKITGEVLR